MNPSPSELNDRVVQLAGALLERARELQTRAEKRQQAELDRMLQSPHDKATLVELTDQAFRARSSSRVAEQFIHILDVQGVPRFFSVLDRTLLHGFQTFGDWLPGVSVPLVQEHMQQETANVVLPAEHDLLTAHLRARQSAGVRMNLNFLGEALLGEDEAKRRMEKYLDALRMPEIEVLSVKISTLYSQISPLAREHTIGILTERLAPLYLESARQRFVRPDGSSVPKFIYLDMEEYRDLHLTAQAFMRTLDLPGLEHVSAGLALQAYIPDSAQVQREINDWARRRVDRGGAPITIRLVKGANLEMERVEAALRDWPQAPFRSKRETDANYQRMLREALKPENLAAVRVGVASHNLFDVAHGLLLADAAGAGDRVQFEMLEGMANHQRRALLEHTKHLLLYAPACHREEFLNAIGYLIRRLDENTGEENFLRHTFRLQVGSLDWKHLEDGFRIASTLPISDEPRRTQDRSQERATRARQEMRWDRFENEPDTDFSLPQNSAWAAALVSAESNPRRDGQVLPIVVAGEEIVEDRCTRSCADPSRPGVELIRYAVATEADVDHALDCAKADPDGWRKLPLDARSDLLGRVAVELRNARGALLRAAIANGGKTIAEADPEISEAIDFVEYYRASARHFAGLSGLAGKPVGAVVVVPPWNFPIAIPCGGVAAALAAGNTVILKPASDTVLVAWELCSAFWRGGVSQRALQFLPCPGHGAGATLVGDSRADAVVLTGGTETALRMLADKPGMDLYAETGGKNAMIVTALSDREQAIKHVVHSAFSHAGQKCSATSLLLLEGEVYDDPEFRETLADAVRSLSVGSAWELSTRVGPLIRPPAGALEHGLLTLEAGESWAVMPERASHNPHLWSPGVKYGVQPGSGTHLTELFGPVLGVMRFEHLDQAIDLVNATGYGLTSGIQSLDDREIHHWQERICAGNLYINKPTVGAIVLRQPFGGWGKSCVGPGIKAGGPNYLAQLMRFAEAPSGETAEIQHPAMATLWEAVRAASPDEPELDRFQGALASYEHWWTVEFSREHDHFRLLGEDNIRRYRPFTTVRVRVDERDSFFEVFARAAAGRVTGARVIVSSPEGVSTPMLDLLDRCTEEWAGAIEFVSETDAQLAELLQTHPDQRIRYAAANRVPPEISEAAAECGAWIASRPVLAHGRVELLWYLREQAISHAYHRYGNLGARSTETRKEAQ